MNKKYKVLLYEQMDSKGIKILEEKCQVVFADSLDEKSLLSRVKDVHGIVIRANGRVSRKICIASPKLKVIGRHGNGVDNIDIEAAREYGIRVVNTPDAGKESIAEHFIGLAIMLLKKIRLGDISVRQGNWDARHELVGMDLYGKTLGILGFGKIGRRIAQICHESFNMKVIYCRKKKALSKKEKNFGEQLSLEDVFRYSDLISINVPLLAETRGMVNSSLLKLMKKDASIINMSRGPIWIEQDIARALQEKWIFGAASDVFEFEPPNPENPLLKIDNFICTPHMSSHTKESLERMSLVALDVVSILEGKEPHFPVV
jgi:D-3-phosphoglycerate dehydrogenase / 2-oxoglutarate reductase